MTPTGKSISVSCSCRASGRGEAVWASVRRRDLSVARGPLSKKSRACVCGAPRRAGLSRGSPVGCPDFWLGFATKNKCMLILCAWWLSRVLA